MTHFDKESFQRALDSGELILADFWAEWCSHCQPLGPIMEELAQRYEGRAVVGKVNVDEARELAMRYGVMSIPTVIVFKNGKPVAQQVGAVGKATYAAMIEQAL